MTARVFGRRLVATTKLSELVPGKPLRLRYPPFHIVVVRLGDEVFAIEDSCNHAGASLAKGPVTADDCIVCPLHGYAFSLRSGALVRPRNLCDDQRKFEVDRDGDNVLIYDPETLQILPP